MYEQEQKQATHLMVLLSNTILSICMIVFTLSHGQGPMATVLLSVGLIVCWTVHLTGTLSAQTRLWLYTILLMLTFFYYGAHEESVFDMAPIAIGFILVYISTRDVRFVRLCAAVYFLTMLYDFLFLPTGTVELPYFRFDRAAIHFLVVFLGERMGEAIIQRLKREREHTADTIARLEEANRSAEDFLANVSHELRTPINAVTGLSTTMLKNETDPEKKEGLSSIQMAGNRLYERIEDILDYSEVDTGRICISEEAYSIPSLINDIIAENQLMHRNPDIDLIFDIDSRIPAVLLGDGRKIKKIIKHLTDNAAKFTKKGGVHVRVYALQKEYGINLCICVSDTGVGIADDEREKISERFFQSSGGKNRKNGGLGLGLPIVYGMIAAMGGFIQVESAEGSGTVVSISIPQKVADASPCMDVHSRADLVGLAVYIRPEKYEVPEVRDYYNVTISHMVRGLELAVHRVYELEELKRLVSMVKLSHLFIGEWEYEENPAYFEQLSDSIRVIVNAGETFQPAENSRIKIVRKPFYNLSVINILNSTDSPEGDAAEMEILTCPGVRVLVVDDEPMNLLVMKGIFKAWNMEVETAESGMQAIALCREQPFDLVFLDHMMPEMDGIETLKELRNVWANAGRRPVVIAFSANVVSGAREMFLREGFDEFIAKPIEDRKLKRLLRKVLPDEAIVYAAGSRETGHAAEELRRLQEKGFRIEEGLQYCNHDSAFYAEVLTRFAQDAEGRISQIEAAFQSEDLENYLLLTHTLKSASKMVGAGDLSEMAENAEKAAKAQDAEYIRLHHEALVDRYRERAQCIRDALKPAKEPQAGAEIPKAELMRYLSELQSALATCELDKVEALLAKASGFTHRDAPVRELLQGVRQAIDDFEWGAASEALDALADRLEGGEA